MHAGIAGRDGIGALAVASLRGEALLAADDRASGPDPVRGEASRAGTGGATVVIERPLDGLARGRYPAPAWLIGLLGGLALICVAAYFVVRLRRRRPR
jgi:hypothetical protein